MSVGTTSAAFSTPCSCRSSTRKRARCCSRTRRASPRRSFAEVRRARSSVMAFGMGRFGVLVASLGLVVGCAGHSARTEAARTALDAGQPGQALAALNKELDVDKAKDLPSDVGGENTLLLLDRAMVLQELGSR